MSETGRVAGRRVLVTGGSGEIGSAIALVLATEGADVAVHYFKNDAEAERIAQALAGMGRKSISVQAQLSNSKEVAAMVKTIHAKFGSIDTLVNCAGIIRDSLFAKMSDDQWEEVIKVNLFGVYHTTKAFVAEIVESGHGRIVNISSIVGQSGNLGQVNYAASKSGIIGFTKALARELASKGTTVNAVAPGFIDTSMIQKIPDKVKESILARIPMGRFGKPREIAQSVLYLVSPDADYITGSVLDLNGGMQL